LAPAGRPSSPRSKANASVGLTATALSPFAGGELQGRGAVIRAEASCGPAERSKAVLHGGWLPAGTLPHPAGY
ncbi:hypothetical protein ACS133_005504, partial [Escherichia coli]